MLGPAARHRLPETSLFAIRQIIERAAAGTEILLVEVEQALDRIGALITQRCGRCRPGVIRLERRLAEAEVAGRRAALGAA